MSYKAGTTTGSYDNVFALFVEADVDVDDKYVNGFCFTRFFQRRKIIEAIMRVNTIPLKTPATRAVTLRFDVAVFAVVIRPVVNEKMFMSLY